MINFGPRWTPEEDAKLREAYASGATPAAREALPHRSEVAIWKRAHRLRLYSPKRWTERDDNLLRWEWNEGSSLEATAKKLGRTAWACYFRAGVLGLRNFAGREHVSAAAERAGFSLLKFRKLLKEFGVPTKTAYSRPRTPGETTKRRHRLVDPAEVNAAVEQWARA